METKPPPLDPSARSVDKMTPAELRQAFQAPLFNAVWEA